MRPPQPSPPFAVAVPSGNGTAPGPETTAKSSGALLSDDEFTTLFVVPPEDLEVEETDGDDETPEVGPPGKQSYFRIHPERSAVVRLLKLESTGKYYLCVDGVQHPDIRDYRVHLVRLKSGKLKLWPIRCPYNGEDFKATRQARGIAADATRYWVAMAWQGGKVGRYKSKTFPGIPNVPHWPDESLPVLIQKAFEGMIIRDSADQRLLELPRFDDDEN